MKNIGAEPFGIRMTMRERITMMTIEGDRMKIEERIKYGALIASAWIQDKNQFSGDMQVRIERTISRRKEWLDIFLAENVLNSGINLLGSLGTQEGRLLCDCLFHSVMDSFQP